MSTKKRVLLTGFPGVGKTTLIKKSIEKLLESNLKISGFYTEELRDESNQRLGFDIVSLDGKREKLARTQSSVPPEVDSRFKIGQYVVFSDEFEKFALPLIQNVDCDVVIIDEIGKMELFSSKFKAQVEDLFKNSPALILATIPVPKGKPIPLVETLRNNPHSTVFTVDRSNRNSILQDIVATLNS